MQDFAVWQRDVCSFSFDGINLDFGKILIHVDSDIAVVICRCDIPLPICLFSVWIALIKHINSAIDRDAWHRESGFHSNVGSHLALSGLYESACDAVLGECKGFFRGIVAVVLSDKERIDRIAKDMRGRCFDFLEIVLALRKLRRNECFTEVFLGEGHRINEGIFLHLFLRDLQKSGLCRLDVLACIKPENDLLARVWLCKGIGLECFL